MAKWEIKRYFWHVMIIMNYNPLSYGYNIIYVFIMVSYYVIILLL